MSKPEQPNSLKDSILFIAGGSGLMVTGMVVSRVFEYAYKIIVAKIGVQEFGIFSLGLAMFGMVSIVSSLGVAKGILRYVPFHIGRGEEGLLRQVIILALRVSLTVSFVVVIAMVLLSRHIAALFFHDSTLRFVVIVLFLALPFYNLKDILVKILLSFQKVKYRVMVYNLIEPLTKVVMAAVFIALGWKLMGVISAYAVSMVVSFLAALFFVEYRTFSLRQSLAQPVYVAWEFISFSLTLVFSDVLYLFMLWTDTFILGIIRTPYEVGIYSGALLISSVLILIPDLLVPVSSPVIVKTYAEGNVEDTYKLFYMTTKLLFCLAVPLALFLFLFGKIFLTLLLGAGYASGFQVIGILLVGKLLFIAAYTSADIIVMLKRTKTIFWVSLTAVILNVALNLLFIPEWGMYGAAAATAISLLLQAIALMAFCRLYFKASFINRETCTLLAINGVAILSIIAVWLAGLKSPYIMFLIYIVAYVFLIYYLGVIKDDEKVFLVGFIKQGMEMLSPLARFKKGKG